MCVGALQGQGCGKGKFKAVSSNALAHPDPKRRAPHKFYNQGEYN